MTYDEVKRFLHKKNIVTDIDGNRIKGIFTNTVSEYDTSSGKEEIELDAGKREELKWYMPIMLRIMCR